MNAVSELLALAKDNHDAGRLLEASRLYRDVLRRDPENAGAWHMSGVLAYQLDERQEAIECLQKAVALSPESSEFHNDLAVVQVALNKFDDAISHCAKALQCDPKNAEAEATSREAYRQLAEQGLPPDEFARTWNDGEPKRILIYSPYMSWYLHTMYEITIAHALKLRGADVKFICCNAVFSDCDQHGRRSPRTDKTCEHCMHCATRVFEEGRMPFEWLGDYVTEGDRDAATVWVNGLSDDELFEADYHGSPLGQWVKSTVHSHYRVFSLDLTKPQINQTYRSYLWSGVLAMEGLNRVFDDCQPEAFLTLCGRFFSHRIAFEIAERRGIRILTQDRGRIDHTLSLYEGETLHSFVGAGRVWQAFKDIPLLPDELEQTDRILADREYGRNTGWRPFTSKMKNVDQLARDLQLDLSKPVVSVFTSSTDEMAASEGWEHALDQDEWITRTIAYFAGQSGWNLVIRIHPNVEIGIPEAREQSVGRIQSLVERGLPENVRIVMPEDPVNSYQLVRFSSHCLIHSSTMAMEVAARGKPVLMTGGGQMFGHSFSTNLANADEYEQALAQFLAEPPSSEAMRVAYRFAHFYFVKMSHPFPLVQTVEVHHARWSYQSLEALLQNKDLTLDRIVDFLLSGNSIHPVPGGSPPSCEAEDRFLDWKRYCIQVVDRGQERN